MGTLEAQVSIRVPVWVYWKGIKSPPYCARAVVYRVTQPKADRVNELLIKPEAIRLELEKACPRLPS